ncbi:hypothetical protein Cma02nite_06680 [Cellulomonas marina]|nr:hypothetical protein Cma02nite_06680 [Cellulomonas marina]
MKSTPARTLGDTSQDNRFLLIPHRAEVTMSADEHTGYTSHAPHPGHGVGHRDRHAGSAAGHAQHAGTAAAGRGGGDHADVAACSS